jgi:hypothetical protein
MALKGELQGYLREILDLANLRRLSTAFSIGSTVKPFSNAHYYFSPIREVSGTILGGTIVYSEKQAIEIAKVVDGSVDCVLVDSEKKIPSELGDTGAIPNIERRVSEEIKKSKLWLFKGNDLTVDAIDSLISHLNKDELGGVGRKNVTILGAGNIGAKLALKLVERGAEVRLTGRNQEKLQKIALAINLIKPSATVAVVIPLVNNDQASVGADILIGATNGIPVISAEIVKKVQEGAIIIDVGKGTLTDGGVKLAQKRNLRIFRLDIKPSLAGLLAMQSMTERMANLEMGRRQVGEYELVSGLLGYKGEIVVDNIAEPACVYGIADGKGDFLVNISRKEKMDLLSRILRVSRG